tara:strand:+ start:838 stop:1707 length:870 start_codon:yes stop_codon:yes gene_type:complete
MAGGMGSRYGGLKQVDSFGPNDESILDYSIFDALKSGFKEVVILSSPKLENYFKDKYQKIFEKKKYHMRIVTQDLNYGLENNKLPTTREKPWGTGHAVLCCENVINNSFSIINADDFYGRDAFKKILQSLKSIENNNIQASIVSYLIENTLSDFGGVSRGVCKTNKNRLLSINETHELMKEGENVVGKYDNIEVKYPLGTEVAMNLIGFQKSIFNKLRYEFSLFLSKNLNDTKKEFLIPDVVNDLIDEEVYISKTNENWFGVTYQDDKKIVKSKIKKLVESGKYPSPLW